VREDVRAAATEVRNIAGHPASSWRQWLILLLQLGKIKISFLATLSTAAGYLLATGMITPRIVVPSVAVFLLACGSCALNQYQERETDRWMERTKSRPIPSGKLSPETAFWISIGLILSGSLILFCGAGGPGFALGVLAVLWYNGIYTSLKHETAFAAIPGALVGAIPPVLGWVTGGGEILDLRIAGIALFFFIWQIPHFWLLLLDCSKDYERAGFPSITKIFSTKQIKRIIFTWLLATGVSSLIIPLSGLLNYFFCYLLLVAAACWLFWSAIIFLSSHDNKGLLRTTFMKLNIYAVLVISLLSLDRLLS
jgi:protoheme IX farnesyltransferase